MIVLGVDPGAAATGLVVRDGDRLIWHATVDRIDPGVRPHEAVLAALTAGVSFWTISRPPDFEVVAVEEVVAPSHYRGQKLLNPKHAVGTALVAGAVAGWAWSGPVEVVWIPPGHNGQGALDAYPAELRPARGQGRGADRLRHERSAWDIAGLAALIFAQPEPDVSTPGPGSHQEEERIPNGHQHPKQTASTAAGGPPPPDRKAHSRLGAR